MTINFNLDSFKSVCDSSKQVMIFGWKSCKYVELANALATRYSTLDWKIGDNKNKKQKVVPTADGRHITQITFHHSYDKNHYTARTCKSAIVNLVLENYRRKQEGLPLIPLLFCFDIDGKARSIALDSLVSKDPVANSIITHKELRRCYKICCQIETEPELKEIAAVAKETIKFIKLAGSDTTEYKMELLTPFWENPEWASKWLSRTSAKQPATSVKPYQWESELKAQIASPLKARIVTTN